MRVAAYLCAPCAHGLSTRVDQLFFFFFQAEDGIRDSSVTGVQTCALPIYRRQVRRLDPVEREQGGQGHEHRQPEAGGAVIVDAVADPVTGRRETRIADGPPPALADVAGGLEIDERDGVIGSDHDVEHVQVVEDHAVFEHHGGGPLDASPDPHGPGRGGGDPPPNRLGRRAPEATGVTGIERLSFDELLGEEVMLADLEVAADLRGYAQAGQLSQEVVFPAEPRYRVRAVRPQARMRPGLLEDHTLPGPLVHRGVDAAAVGEVQRRLDVVGQFGDGHRVAGGQVRRQEIGHPDPGRHGEHRRPRIGHKVPRWALDRGHHLAPRTLAISFGEATVTHVERTGAVSQVAQDIGTWRAVERRVELGKHVLTGGLVPRVYGADFSAGAARRIFRIAHKHGQPTRQEFERNIPGYAVSPYLRHYFIGIIETGGYVYLPSLRGDRRAWGDVDQPVT